MSKSPQVSVFVPVYNEEAILEANAQALLERLERDGLDYEVIIGSNGSTDRTPQLGLALQQGHPRLRFFHLDQRGPGRAFARALEMAQAPCLVTLDMDLSVSPAFVPQALELLREHDVVVGDKRQGREERSWARVLGSGLYIACARLLLGLPFRDYSIGAKGFRLELARGLPHLVDRHTAYAGNLICAAHFGGRRVAVLPVTCSDRRRSHFNLGHEGFYRLWWLMRLAWNRRRPGYFSVLTSTPDQSAGGGSSR
ncbi:MAG: glycosyltransferase family 2 protein [Desulfarculus sp.]|nr:glycosyltransferase family 2 protein [Desulfarculus sp.]